MPAVDSKRLLTAPLQHIPKGAKLLRTEAKRGGVFCIFGIFHSMQQFVQISRNLKHPFDEFVNVPDILLICMYKILTMGPVQVSKHRLDTILKWKQLRQSLKGQEAKLHERIPERLAQLMTGKQFLMLQKLAEDIGWPDTSIHEEMLRGFRLVGKGSVSGVFKPEVKHAVLSEKELVQKAKYIRPMIIGRVINA